MSKRETPAGGQGQVGYGALMSEGNSISQDALYSSKGTYPYFLYVIRDLNEANFEMKCKHKHVNFLLLFAKNITTAHSIDNYIYDM